MKYIAKKLLIVGMWLLVTLIWWQSLAFLNNQLYDLSTFSAQNLNSKQQQLYEKYLSENQKLTPKVFVNESGEVIYQYVDKFYGDIAYHKDAPDWYKNGEVVLTEKQKQIIIGAALITRPSWFFWTDSVLIEVSHYNNIFDILSSSLAMGFLWGVSVVLFSSLRARVFDGAGLDLKVAVLFGLIVGIGFGIVTSDPQAVGVSTLTIIFILAIDYLATFSCRLWRSQ